MTQPFGGQAGPPPVQIQLQPESIASGPGERQQTALEEVQEEWVTAIKELLKEDWGITLTPNGQDLDQEMKMQLLDDMAAIGDRQQWAAEYARLELLLGQDEMETQMRLMTHRQLQRLRTQGGQG